MTTRAGRDGGQEYLNFDPRSAANGGQKPNRRRYEMRAKTKMLAPLLAVLMAAVFMTGTALESYAADTVTIKIAGARVKDPVVRLLPGPVPVHQQEVQMAPGRSRGHLRAHGQHRA